jgi:DNA-binding NarL/FixJ family response regulator
VIRVLLADDQVLVRGALRVLLQREEGIDVAGEAADGEQAVALARRERPDVVLMDISMPGVDGLEATRRIAADPELVDMKVIVLTTFGSDQYVLDALRGGASGFLEKDSEPAELVHAIRVIAAGNALLFPSLTRRLIEELLSRSAFDHTIPTEIEWLTEREREVLTLVAAGLSNHEIALKLVVSPATAKTHVSRAMRKLQAHDRAQLVVIAYETGLVSPGHVTGSAHSPQQSLAANGS